MTQYEMTEKLAEKCEVTMEEAMTALQASNWNTLTATHLLEQEKFRRMQELNAFAEAGEAAAVQAAPEAETAQEAAQVEAEEAPAQAAAEAISEEAQPASEGSAKRAASKKHCRDKGLRNLGAHIRRLVACGNRNRFAVHRGDEQLLAMPVTALVLLMLCAFWVCLPLLVIGLFAGCRYSFSGKDLGREGINSALNKAADAADRVKQTVAHA